jgi:hypothetical protein
MTIDRRLLAGALGLSLVVAACGGSSTASSGAGTATSAPTSTAATPATATDTPATSEEPTEAAGTEEPATEAPTDNAGTGSSGQMNSLAEKLPAEAGGIKFERAGYDGSQLGAFGAAAGLNSGQLDPILQANGKTINDVNFAIATSSSSEVGGMIYAIQIEGVDATKFATGMNQDLSTMPKQTIAGKTVYGQATGGFGLFVYPKDDMLFLILLVDEKTATAILEQLP